MKKTISLLMAVALLALLVACGKQEPGPDNIVREFCNAMKAFDTEKMQECIVSDEDVMDKMNLTDDEDGKWFFNYLKEWAGRMTYEIDAPKIDGENATVSVRFKCVDASSTFTQALSDYLLKSISMAFSGAAEEEFSAMFEEVFKEKIEAADLSTAEKTVVFECKKMEDGWKINTLPNDALYVLTSNIFDAYKDFKND